MNKKTDNFKPAAAVANDALFDVIEIRTGYYNRNNTYTGRNETVGVAYAQFNQSGLWIMVGEHVSSDPVWAENEDINGDHWDAKWSETFGASRWRKMWHGQFLCESWTMGVAFLPSDFFSSSNA